MGESYCATCDYKWSNMHIAQTTLCVEGNSTCLNENYYNHRLTVYTESQTYSKRSFACWQITYITVLLPSSPCPRFVITDKSLNEQIAHILTIASINPRRLYCKTRHMYIYIHITYSTVGTLPPPHDYMSHAMAFSNKQALAKHLGFT